MNHVDFTKDLTKWLEVKMKLAKKNIELAEKEESFYGGYSDCGDFYREQVLIAKNEMNTLREIKVGIERYSKKVSYEEQDK